MGIKIEERTIDVSELYVADEAFACGTSAFVAPVIEIDKRPVGTGSMGPLTEKLRTKHHEVLHGQDRAYRQLLTLLS
jgi:branched-chain amino acid aminotransferase